MKKTKAGKKRRPNPLKPADIIGQLRYDERAFDPGFRQLPADVIAQATDFLSDQIALELGRRILKGAREGRSLTILTNPPEQPELAIVVKELKR